MKNLRRVSAVALIGAVAVAAAYACWPAHPGAGAAKLRPVAPAASSVDSPAMPRARPAAAAARLASADDALLALRERSGICGISCSAEPANMAQTSILDGTCSFCLSEAEDKAEVFDSAALDDPWRLPADSRIGLGLSGIADGLNGAAFFANGVTAFGLEPNVSAVAPAPEISTAAMLALGIVMLTTGHARRKVRARWKAVWALPALPRAC
jgi:hypothetical protein